MTMNVQDVKKGMYLIGKLKNAKNVVTRLLVALHVS